MFRKNDRMKDSWKIEFKDKMDLFKEPVPEGLWTDVSNSMTKKSPKKKGGMLYFRIAGIAAAVSAAIFGATMLISDFHHKHVESPNGSITCMTGIKDITGLTAWEKTPASPVPINMPKIRIHTPVHEEAESLYPEDIIKYPETSEEKKDEEKERQDIVSVSEYTECDLSLVPDYMPSNCGSGRKRKFSISASVSGNTGGTDVTSGYGSAVPANSAAITSFGNNPEAEIRLFNRTREVNTDTKYAQPVRAGISFRWYFSRIWSIESGIAWSWLHSKTTSGSTEYYSTSTQDMHYIGIPVRLNCDFWSGKNMRAYASAEAMAEKCIAGKSVSVYTYNGASGPFETTGFREKQMQWSLSAHAGFQYDFTGTVGIYAEPGISWHIDNKSGVNNIYKAHPVGLSLGAGLRFSF